MKAVPNAFVAKRSQWSQQAEYSPMPDAFSNFADEDTWMKMNKGFVADLDLLHMTPAVKIRSSLPDDENDVSPLSHTCSAILLLTKTVSAAASCSYAIANL